MSFAEQLKRERMIKQAREYTDSGLGATLMTDLARLDYTRGLKGALGGGVLGAGAGGLINYLRSGGVLPGVALGGVAGAGLGGLGGLALGRDFDTQHKDIMNAVRAAEKAVGKSGDRAADAHNVKSYFMRHNPAETLAGFTRQALFGN